MLFLGHYFLCKLYYLDRDSAELMAMLNLTNKEKHILIYRTIYNIYKVTSILQNYSSSKLFSKTFYILCLPGRKILLSKTNIFFRKVFFLKIAVKIKDYDLFY